MKKYELWGHDEFANETFLVGTYDTLKQAKQHLAKCKKEVEGQDKSMRDSFWIVEMSPERVIEREAREAEYKAKLDEDERYNPQDLREAVIVLVDKLIKLCETTDFSTIAGVRNERGLYKTLIVEHDIAERRNCFTKILFEVFSPQPDELVICLQLNFKDGEILGGGSASQCPYRMPIRDVARWLKKPQAISEICGKMSDLINSFYKHP